MRRIALLAAIGSLVLVGAFSSLGGCSSDEETPANAAGADSGGGGTSGATSGGTGGTSGGTGGTSGATSGGTSGGTSGTTPPTPVSNPGQITCGASQCDAGGGGGSGRCCLGDGGAVCKGGGGSGNNDCDEAQADFRCDEPKDCPEPDRGRAACCFGARLGDQVGARCQAVFGPTPERCIQLCKTAADCGDGGACSEKTCRGFKVMVCGAPEGCQ